MALHAELDKSSYEPGEVMTLTITTAVDERNRDKPVTAHVNVEGVGDFEVTGKIDLPDALITVADSARVWQKKTDDGVTAIYTATAA